MSVRVYVPATFALLADLQRDGELPASVDRFEAADDSEEAEYSALLDGADASRALIGGPGRRVVVVAELPSYDGPVPLSRVVAVHVDTREDADEDDDLAWFATQEIPHLLA
jgi:hypothetical protein